jgi:hypothetical protein
MDLRDQRAELERLGYSIVSESDQEIVGVLSKWYWDALATKLTSVVFVRSLPVLTASEIRADAVRMTAAAKGFDPSRLPQGLQKNRAAIAVYLAETVEPDARQICESPQPIRLAALFYPAALESSSGTVLYSGATPLWGGVFYAKLRYVVQRLLEPDAAPAKEPVSAFGVAMSALVGALLALGLASLVLAAMRG